MVLDKDVDLDMESAPRDDHVEPQLNLRQLHLDQSQHRQHHRQSSRDHAHIPLPELGFDPHHQLLDHHRQSQLHPQFDDLVHARHDDHHDHDHHRHDRYSVPSAPLAAANYDSVASNAQHAFPPVNPDDFYKSYRVLHFTNNPDVLPMAASVPRPSLRSNGDGSTPKHSTVASPSRNLRGNLRSASNPVDNRPAAAGHRVTASPGHLSVRDLKKRFDQNGASTSIPRAPTQPNPAARVKRDGGSSTHPRNGATSYSTLRTGMTQNPGADPLSDATSPRSQRSRFVAEDQVSSNSQSFASRIGKPRSSVSGNPNASRSMTNLAPKSPSQPQPQPQLPASPTHSRSQGLLFGEILPEQHDPSLAGYGIEGVRPRRTSESELHQPWSHQRSLSDPDAEPSSPSLWYRSLDGEGMGDQNQLQSAQKGHLRSQSAVPTSKNTPPTTRNSATRRPPSSQDSAPSSVSKLPLSVRKLSSPTGSSSPSSTRSSSPSTLKRTQANGRTSRAGTPASRAKTSTTRAKTPTQGTSSRKPPPRALATPTNSNRLQANIIAPPPKLSPPLRSSRPRQPVSMATTASSRMKVVERAKSPNPTSRPPTRIAEPTTRRRKISVGPIDFEQRREHIRLAYTKSIRESQALEARQLAADRRRKEMEAAAKAKAIAAAAAISATSVTESDTPSTASSRNPPPRSAASGSTTAEPSPVDDVPPVPGIPAIHNLSPTSDTPTVPEPAHSSEVPIVVDAVAEEDFHTPGDASDKTPLPSPHGSAIVPAEIAAALPPDALLDSPQVEAPHTAVDSPTLGIPGGFPGLDGPVSTVEDRPQTALSATSETTEFDGEAQTAPPVHAPSPLEVPITIVKPPSPRTASPPRPRAEYQYPFQDEPDSPNHPETNQSPVEASLESRLELRVESPVIPGAFNDDFDADPESHEVQSPYEATVTILPPSDALPMNDYAKETIPFPRMATDDVSDCQSDLELDGESEHHDPHEDEDAATDACTEETDDHNRTDECRSESQFGDQISSHRASTCESSDAEATDGLHYTAFDQQQTPDTSRSLMVPTQSAADRTSQASAWTDFSIESGNYSDATRSLALQDGDEDSPSGYATIFETRSIHRENRPTSRPQDSFHSQPQMRPSIESARSLEFLNPHHLPELDTGDGFTIPYLSKGSSQSYPYVPSPSHEPPPIPTPATESACNSQRTSGVFYGQSQYGSTLVDSERGSEDYLPTMATPQTIDTTSTPEQYFPTPTADDEVVKPDPRDKDKGEPTGKEKARLIQRRNVIKELVDTEAVFVRDMNIVEEIYKGTAEACPKLDSNTVKLIFRNTDEIIDFHTSFLAEIKEAVLSVYAPQGRRSALSREESFMSESSHFNPADLDDTKDRATAIGPVFKSNMEKMKLAHEGFLRNSDHAAKRLIQIQQDPTVKVWLNECNEVAKDLTAAWDLDSLLIKPMQRITKYPNLIITLLQHTPKDHPDRVALISAKDTLETAIIEINKTKKNFELVGQIVGRKRKESDVKAGFARAFGKRVDKLQTSGNRPPEDPEYAKYNEKFGDDYLRLQVVLRDVEFYTRQVSAYVHEFLQYLSSIELVMRIQPGNYPELESKWVQFNISIRDLEKVALEDHLSQVRKHVIEPFELVIKAYGNPSLAMKKRQKRRVDFERYEQLRKGGKSVDSKLMELVEQYEALNDTLKKELPRLSALTEKVGNICLGNFVNIQVKWYGIWKDKMKVVLGDCPDIPDLQEVVSTFQRDFPYAQEQMANIGILNPAYRGRMSQSTTISVDESLLKVRSRPSDIDSARGRGLSLNGEHAPTLPTPEFIQRNSGSFTTSPTSLGGTATGTGAIPSPHQYYYRDYYMGISSNQPGTASPLSPEVPGSSRSLAASTRPSTGRSFDSGAMPRQSTESTSQPPRDSNTTYSSNYPGQEGRRFSGLFHSALPLPDGPDESRRSSRASSRERAPATDGYNVLWLAASLFEFNIATTKHEAGYPYLIYQAGEIFDVIAEKGELWLAKNQDDPDDQVGWIWSKHFAKLADA